MIQFYSPPKLVKRLAFIFLLLVGISQMSRAQAPTISYPTAAQNLSRGIGDSLLTIKLVFNAVCPGSVRLGLPASVTYVAGTVTKTSGTAGVSIAELSIANLSKPTFSISGVAAIGDEITFTVARRAGCGSLATAKDSVYFISGGGGCADGSETLGTVNTYNIFAPTLPITPAAALTGVVVGSTYSRTTVVTNGGNGPTDTVRFYIVYPSAGIANSSGTNAVTANGVSFTPSSINGDTLFYKFFGATIFGGNNLLTSGETVTIVEPIRVLKCNTTTTYGSRWGRNDASICITEVATSSMTMAIGVPNWSTSGSGYIGYVNMCTTTSYNFTITNTGTGVSAAASMYSIDFVHGLSSFTSTTDGINNSSSRMFTLSNVRVGSSSAVYSYTGAITSQEMHIDATQFSTDPDGAGVGLEDLDGDGQYDDLAPGQTATITVDLTYRDISVCGATGPGYIHPASGPVVNVRYATMCNPVLSKPYANKNTGGFYYYGASTFSNSAVLPANIVAGTPFNVSISSTPINFNWPSNSNTRWRWRFIMPANLAPTGTPTYGGVGTTYAILPSATTPVGDTVIVTSKSPSLSTVSINFVYTCGANGPLSVPYELERIDDSISGCLMNNDIICNSFSTNVTGCPTPCSAGPVSYIPQIRRTDNSLGYTNATLTTRISAASLTERQLQHAWFLDTFQVGTPMRQVSSFNNLYARLRLDKASGIDKITPLSATAEVYRAGVLVSSCALTSWSVSGSTATYSDFVWDLSSCLPSGSILNGDSVFLLAKYYVSNLNLPQAPNILASGGSSYFFNLDALGNEVSCGGLVPELYLQSPVNGASMNGSPLALNGCTSGAKGPGTRQDVGAPNVMELYRPTVFIDSFVAIVPADLDVTGLTITSSGVSETLSGVSPTSVSGTRYSYINPGTWPLTWGVNGAVTNFNVNFQPSCKTPASSTVQYFLYYRLYYYSEAVPKTSYPTINNVPQSTSSWSLTINHLNTPNVTVQNNTGTVQGVNVNQHWDVQINNIGTNTAPYVWMALEKGIGTGGIVVDSVKLLPSLTTITPTSTYNGTDKWYQISTAGLASATSQQARVFFHYTSCTMDSILLKSGWNCSGYPSPDPTSYSCSTAQAYLKLDPQASQVQLSVLRQPGGGSSIDLCTTDSTLIVLNSAQAANLVSPYVTFFPPAGLTLVTPIKVEYPRGSGNYQNATVTSIPGGGYKIDLSAHTGIGASGMFGTANASPSYVPLGGDREAKIKVDFTTDCSFTSGTSFTFNAYGNRPCGAPAIDNGIAATTSKLDITGATAVGGAGVSISFGGGATSVGCGSTAVTLSLITTPTSLGTTAGDTMTYTLPAGMGYAGNLTPGYSAVVTGGGGAPTIVKVAMPTGVAPSTPINFNFDVTPKGGGCGAVNILGAYQRRIASLLCGGVPCASSSVIISSATSPNITLVKPNLSITNATIVDTNKWIMGWAWPNHVKIYYNNNNGSQAYTANTDSVEFFCGASTTPFAVRPLTKSLAIGASDSDSYTIVVPTSACTVGEFVTAKIQTVMNSGTEQCLCSPASYFMAGFPLPLSFTSTNINAQNCAVNIRWSYNLSGGDKLASFEIERSSNGAQYEKVSSQSANNTSYVDITPSSGKWYYRIKAVGVDGKISYSNTLQATTSHCAGNSVTIYPNPASEQLNIVVQGSSVDNQYELVDALGRVVLKGKLNANANNKLDVSVIAHGVYMLKVQTEAGVQTQQVQIR